MDNLSFDPVIVDTALAEEYIKTVTEVKKPESGTVWDYVKEEFIEADLYSQFYSATITEINQKLRNLAKALEDNSELICQLEYLMRKRDVEETRNCHLKLILQYLRLEEGKTRKNYIVIAMDKSTPLYYLGHVATLFRNELEPVIICNKITAPICQLFRELCSEVGLETSWHYMKSDVNSVASLPPMGCTLAITEEADMDSAVDVFLNSSVEAPWRIERIYVQESVYDQLMETLETRCTREDSERCVDAFRTAGGRRVECGVGAGGGVPVRAYRGARDLLDLLPREGALSLWCGAAAAAHELALAAPANLVWIDHYAVFDGPPSASIPLYNHTTDSYYIPESVDTRLRQLQRTWTTLSLDERKAVVLNVVKVASDCKDYDEDSEVVKFAEDITDWMPPADLVDIAPHRITMVINLLTDAIILSYKDMLEVLKLAILGFRIVTPSERDNNYSCLITKLFNAGVPVTESELTDKNPECTHEIKAKLFYRNKKVIQSRY